MPKASSATSCTTPLSRGRTPLRRKHDQVGTVVHEAEQEGHYVHLTVGRYAALDTERTFTVIQNNDDDAINVRITVGESEHALMLDLNRTSLATFRPLINNLYVEPYERVVISVSDPSANIVVFGFTTKRAIWRH